MEKVNKELRRNYISMATDLCYPEHIIQHIKDAKTEEEITKWMITGRHLIKD